MKNPFHNLLIRILVPAHMRPDGKSPVKQTEQVTKPEARPSVTPAQLKAAFAPLIKDVYEFEYAAAESIDGLESFTSQHFIGDPSALVSKETGEVLTFLYQIKHPEADVWYRVYIDNHQWESSTYLMSQTNGEMFTVQKFAEQPKIEVHPEIDTTNLYIQPRNSKITLNKKRQLPDWESMDGLDRSVREQLNSLGKWDWNDLSSLREQEGLMHGKSHLGGYPDWIQGLEIPDGFELSDFVFEIASEYEVAKIGIGDSGSLYVFEKDGEFGVVWQCY